MRRTTTAAALAAGALLVTAWPTAAAADQTYQTQKYPLMAVGGAPEARGWVINTHTNGPVNYGQERYFLAGAAPSTQYAVSLEIFVDPACAASTGLVFPTATLRTNGAGVGHAKATFFAQAVAPLVLEPTTLYGEWTFSTGKPAAVAYTTGCQAIDLDVPPPPPPGRAGR